MERPIRDDERDSRPLEFYSGRRLFLSDFGDGERGGTADRALKLPVHISGLRAYAPGISRTYPDIYPRYTKNPMSFDMGFSVQK